MARYMKGALGAFSGKLGNVVGANWRHIDYLRSLPRPSKKPATELQLAQQAKFRLAVSFLSTIKDVVNLGFGDESLGKSTGYNEALKLMLHNAIVGSYPEYEIDYEKVVISKGSLAALMSLTFSEASPMDLEYRWEFEPNRFNSFADDEVVILLYNKTKNLFSIYENAQRDDLAFQVTMPNSFEGDEIVSWVFLVKNDGKAISPSQFAGELIVVG